MANSPPDPTRKDANRPADAGPGASPYPDPQATAPQDPEEFFDRTIRLDVGEIDASHKRVRVRTKTKTVKIPKGKSNGWFTETYNNLVSNLETFVSGGTSIDINLTAGLEQAEPLDLDPEEEEAQARLNRLAENFELKEEIARGGQAIISTAYDKTFKRVVAVKSLIHSERADRVRNFLTEANVTAQLDHPAVVPVYGLYGDDEKQLHLAMKLIRGVTLKDYLRITREKYRQLSRGSIIRNERRLLWHRMEIFLRVCEAISYVHHRKVIHRDLKPENIMLGNFNETYVMDWGIAEYQGEGQQFNRPRKMAGTLQYIAPEVIGRKQYDTRSDIFLLGLILYEIVFLKSAYPKPATREEAVYRAQHCLIEPFEHRFGCRVALDLEAIIAKAIAPSPDQRYATVKELEADINAYRRGDEVSANPDSTLNRLMRKMRNHYKLFLFLSVALLLLFTSYAAFTFYREQQQSKLNEQKDRMLAELYSNGLRSSSKFDRLFLRYEGLIATACREAAVLLEGEPRKLDYKYYFFHDGLAEKEFPPDFAYAPAYAKGISFDHSVYLIPNNRFTSEIRRDMPLFYPLRKSLANVVFGSLDGAVEINPAWSRKELEQYLREKERPPIFVIYTGLEDGLHVGYPYEIDYSADYDPRERPWYKESKADPSRAIWSRPYVDIGVGGEIVITCSYPVMMSDGTFNGVTGADVTLSRMLDLLELTGNNLPCVDNKFIVDAEGKIIADSKKRFEPIRDGEDLEFKTFPNPGILGAMRQRESGWVFNPEAAGNYLYLFFKIESLNWNYVERINFDRALTSEELDRAAAKPAPAAAEPAR